MSDSPTGEITTGDSPTREIPTGDSLTIGIATDGGITDTPTAKIDKTNKIQPPAVDISILLQEAFLFNVRLGVQFNPCRGLFLNTKAGE